MEDAGAEGARIRPIDRADVHRITSAQVVLDLHTAVKEVVENALDAGATSIEVRFKDYGAEAFEVIDNGSGIDPKDYEGIALKHHTSKLASFSDLETVQTFGFRGEALSSLCALASVTMHTATAPEAPVGTVLNFEKSGKVIAGSRKLPRQRGTTVTVSDLFKGFPVRRREFEKNLKREYSKAQNVLQAYALIQKGVRFIVHNIVKGSGRKTVQMSMRANSSESFLLENVTDLLGAKVAATLEPIGFELEMPSSTMSHSSRNDNAGRAQEDGDAGHAASEGDSNDKADDQLPKAGAVRIVGAMSKLLPTCGRTSADRQFFYINGRPWEGAKFARVFNEVYRSNNTDRFPVVIANFVLPAASYDLNITPDKRTIFLHSESALQESLRNALEAFVSKYHGVFSVNGLIQPKRSTQSQIPAAWSSERASSPPSTSIAIQVRPSTREGSVEQVNRDSESQDTGDDVADAADLSDSESSQRGASGAEDEEAENHEEDEVEARGSPRSKTDSTQFSGSGQLETRARKRRRLSASSETAQEAATAARVTTVGSHKPSFGRSSPFSSQSTHLEQGSSGGTLSEKSSVQTSTTTGAESNLDRDPDQSDEEKGKDGTPEGIEGDDGDEDVTFVQHTQVASLPPGAVHRTPKIAGSDATSLRVDSAWILQRAARDTSDASQAGSISASQDLAKAGVGEDAAEAEEHLQRVISKPDFAKMEVIGQFNLGFIIARRRIEAPSHSDGEDAQRNRSETGELHNDDLFIVDQHASDEKYNFERLQADTIIQSQKLIQPRTLELPVSDEMVAIDHLQTLKKNGFELDVDEDAAAGSRLKLVAQPVSKSTSFGPKDLAELLHLLRNLTPGSAHAQAMRCSKARAMFASRACRSSVMVGKSLSVRQMRTILTHMGTIDQPWNCPHGRPTMRHLVSMSSKADVAEAPINWNSIL